MKKFFAPLMVAATLAFTAAPVLADNSATAVNTKNGSTVFDFSFKVEQIVGSVVNPINSAIAYASCSYCTTVAIAVDIVFATGNPSTVTPTNQAIAVNYMCTACNTLADAYQFVVITPGPVELTAQGKREVARIRRDLARLRHENLSIPQLNQQVAALMGELQHVLATQLVPEDTQQNNEEGDKQRATPSPSSSPSSSPSTGASPASSPGSSTPTPSPSPSH